jgi:hypothetical protein
MGRGKSSHATTDFVAEQINKTAQVLDQRVIEDRFRIDLQAEIAKFHNDPSIPEVYGRAYSAEAIEEYVNDKKTTPVGFGHLLSHLHPALKEFENKALVYIPNDAEISALKELISLSKKVGVQDIRFWYSVTFEDVLKAGKITQISSDLLLSSTTPDAQKYRFACAEWGNKLVIHLDVLHRIYSGREIIKRSKRVTYKALEDLGNKVQSSRMDKLDAYKEFGRITVDANKAFESFIKLAANPPTLMSLAMNLTDLQESVKKINTQDTKLQLD